MTTKPLGSTYTSLLSLVWFWRTDTLVHFFHSNNTSNPKGFTLLSLSCMDS